MLEFGHMTHPGNGRSRNEETYYGDLDNRLWLVAAGIGGQGRGECASAIVRDTTVAEVLAGQTLEHALRSADHAIVRTRGSSTSLMGSSVVALRVQRERFAIACVGDTHAYVWTDHHSRPLCAAPPADAQPDNNKGKPSSVIRHWKTHALGITDPAQLQISSLTGAVCGGMQWLLCSDGIAEHVDHRTRDSVLRRADISAQECVDLLVAAALDTGCTENLTLLLIRTHSSRGGQATKIGQE